MEPMRPVRIRDTLSGELTELDGSREVGIYACGPTVYSRIHVGNARPYVLFTLLRRFLAHEGYRPKLVINVTDINDKIYAAAREAGVASAAHAAEMTRLYLEDTARLGIGRPDAEPLATETLAEIISMIEALIASGHAYESGGDVYFRVRSFDGYGKLSNRDPDEMDQGEEAGSAQLKQSPLDFALWKARKPDEDTGWSSPWGDGRPGWHIECSAMAEKLLGTNFAIHGGGTDLIFPHHENEIAQTEAARGEPLARIWMHNGMIRTAEQKMSKSVGNIFQLSEAIDRFGAEAVVAYLSSGHYRQPVEFSERALTEAQARVQRLRNYLDQPPDESEDGDLVEDDDFVAARREAFLDALADDFNTPRAWAALFEIVAEGNRRGLPGGRAAVVELVELLGLEALLAPAAKTSDPQAEALLRDREQARAERDYGRADEIRERLAALGWDVRDTPNGARLRRRD